LEEHIKELFKQAQNGDKEARDRLIVDNIRLVHAIAKKYLGMEYYDSIVQEGMIGLIKAVDNFEIDRELQFSTYAFWKIKGEMQRYIRDKREDMPYRILREEFTVYRKIRDAKKKLSNELNREPNIQEISNELEMDASRISETINILENHTSFQKTKYRNEEGKEDILMSDAALDYGSSIEEDVINKIIIEKALENLTKKQREVISLRYFKEYSQTKTGQVLNISQAQISRIERQALNILKEVI